jgi:hypothetical protein
MFQDDPAKRPTIDEVVSHFDDIQHGLSSWKLRSRVIKISDNGLVVCFRGIGHWPDEFSISWRVFLQFPVNDY